MMDSEATCMKLTPRDMRPVVAMANVVQAKVGTAWGPRILRDWELVFVVRGEFTYTPVGEDAITAVGGDVLCIPPGEDHVLRCQGGAGAGDAVISCMHLELFEGRWIAGDYALASLPPRLTPTGGDPLFHFLFKRCRDVFEGYDPYRSELVNAMACEIVLLLASIWKQAPPRQASPRARRMQTFLRQRVKGAVSRHDLAKEFGLTPEHVNVIFKREVGVSPRAFINRERVLLAYDLLMYEGLSVKEVAYRTGFTDPFHFSKVFKKIMGMPPSYLLHSYGRLLTREKRG